MRKIFAGNSQDGVLVALFALVTVVISLLVKLTLESSDQTVALINIIGGLIVLLFPIMKATSKERIGVSDLLILAYAMLILFVGVIYLFAPDSGQTIEIQPRVPDNFV